MSQWMRVGIRVGKCGLPVPISCNEIHESLENKGSSNQKVALITQRSRVQIPPPQPFTKSLTTITPQKAAEGRFFVLNL